MATFISLLRGINVSGQKGVKMADLEKMFIGMGFANVRTYIQSGNVVFESASGKASAPELENAISKKIKSTFGFDVGVIVRTPAEFEKIIKNNPFKGKDEGRLYVSFLSESPPAIPSDAIDSAKGKSEEYSISGKEIYLFFPDGYGRAKLSNNFFDSKLKVVATTRNWNTVNKLLNMCENRSDAGI